MTNKSNYSAPITEELALRVDSTILGASLLNNGGSAFGEVYDTDSI